MDKHITLPLTEELARSLKAGDIVDVTGFVYWYEGINTHITAIAIAE